LRESACKEILTLGRLGVFSPLGERANGWHTGFPSPVLEIIPLAVTKGGNAFRRERVGEKTAAQATDPEASRFFGGEYDEFDASASTEAGIFKCANCFKSAQHTHDTIETASIGNCVYVGTRCNGRQFAFRTFPEGKDIADGILADGEAEFGTHISYKGA